MRGVNLKRCKNSLGVDTVVNQKLDRVIVNILITANVLISSLSSNGMGKKKVFNKKINEAVIAKNFHWFVKAFRVLADDNITSKLIKRSNPITQISFEMKTISSVTTTTAKRMKTMFITLIG